MCRGCCVLAANCLWISQASNKCGGGCCRHLNFRGPKVCRKVVGRGAWGLVDKEPPYTFVRFVTGCTLPTPLFLSFTRFSCFSSFIVVCSSAVIICRFILRHMWPGITLLDFPHCQLFQLSLLSLLSASFFPFIRAEKWAQFMRSAPMGGRRQGKLPGYPIDGTK